jgi:thiol-disulfide isomerase/thioredoxin
VRQIALAIAMCVALLGEAPVPRPAPALKIGAQDLSSWRGRVVLLAFISTECPHCQRVSQVFEGLLHEFGGRVQVADVAFNEGADPGAFVKRFGLSFPVGSTTSDGAHVFLGIPRGMRLGTPQVVVIDRAGVIRAQSERLGTPLLQTLECLRSLLNALLKPEPAR